MRIITKLSYVVAGAAAAALILVSAPADACSGAKKNQQASIGTIGVDALARALAAEQPPTVVDANGTQTRAQYGVIPGAVLLSHFVKYDVTKELPASRDQAVVFYCASQKCSAAPQAAQRAADAGYTNVSVMPDGISGWTAAGKPVTTINES